MAKNLLSRHLEGLRLREPAGCRWCSWGVLGEPVMEVAGESA
ncbi:hypothetical protein [Kamptonema formosum]|nr:hypothetical protein [Oscillatoria sp. PCC 10802]